MITHWALVGSTAMMEKPVPGPLRKLTRVRATTVAPGANPPGTNVGVMDGVRVMVGVLVAVRVAVAVAVEVTVGGAAVSRR